LDRTGDRTQAWSLITMTPRPSGNITRLSVKHQMPDRAPAHVDASPAAAKRAMQGKIFTKLPSLNLFRVFDAAARHRSFRLAAAELCVTPSAVSQQIRQLEDFLGFRLFRRLPQQVELTREGMVLAEVVKESLAMLLKGCNRLVDPTLPTVICLNASSSLASRWLLPRLKKFMEFYPHIKITLIASNDPIDFRRQDMDIAIRWGNGSWGSEVHAEPLTADYHFPVCSPEYLEREPISSPKDLEHRTILHEVVGSSWSEWFEVEGHIASPFTDVLYFSDAALMLEAAAQGQGLCLTNYMLAEKDLRSGRLIQPFSKAVDLAREGYYLLRSPHLADKPATMHFQNWLQAEALSTVSSFGKPQ
jgi:LysR family glycine cleavage system transcriptional activator